MKLPPQVRTDLNSKKKMLALDHTTVTWPTHSGMVPRHETSQTLCPWAGPGGGAWGTTMLLLVAVGAKVIRALRTDMICSTTQVADLMTLGEGGEGGEREREDHYSTIPLWHLISPLARGSSWLCGIAVYSWHTCCCFCHRNGPRCCHSDYHMLHAPAQEIHQTVLISSSLAIHSE